jgi:hypothetical protein
MSKSNVVPTPLSYFGSHIRGAKDMGQVREVIANASSALEKFASSTEKRDELVAKLEAFKDDEIVYASLSNTLAGFKASDSDSRKATHVATCVVVNGLKAKLDELCEASRFTALNEQENAEAIALVRTIADFAQRFIPMAK